MKNNLKAGEQFEDLCLNGAEIIQHKDKYRFTSDAVLLANFAKLKKGDKCVELCSGSGIVSILLALKNKPEKIIGIEIQEDLAEMSKRSVEHNNLQDVIEIVNMDAKNIFEFYEKCRFDVVVCNPPYKPTMASTVNVCNEIAIARHEIKINLAEVVKISADLLRFGGKLFMVHDASRIAEICTEFSKNDIAVKKIQFTQSSDESEAKAVLIEGVKGGKPGARISPVFITNNADGTYKEEARKGE